MAAFQQGLYRVRVTAQAFVESKEKKSPGFELAFVPLGRIDPNNDAGPPLPCERFEQTTTLWISSDKSAARVTAILEGLGWPGGKWSTLDPSFGNYSFVGQEIELECRHEQGQSQTFDRWEFPFAGGGGGPSANISSLAAKLDTLYGGAARPVAKPAAKPAAKQAVHAPPLSDEIPF